MPKRITAEENDLLTRTGPGSEMGQLMRRYWFPAFLSERLPAEGAEPIEVTLLGERLVAFRGSDGQVGLLDARCPHRRASLVIARQEDDCALRCIYHGWKIDRTGRVLETPPEPPNSRFAQSIRHTAYPTREAAGMVWTYMGPTDLEPEFPRWPFIDLTPEHVWSNHFLQHCNWLQGLEGDLDAAHGGYLHYSKEEWERQRQSPSKLGKFLFDPRPQTAVEPADWGLQTAFRLNLPDENEAVFWIHPLVSPFFTMFSHAENGVEGGLFHAWVPGTDETHYVYSVIWKTEEPLTPDDRARVDLTQRYTDVDRDNNYVNPAWDGTRYVQDRDSMHTGASFSGFRGVHLQDLAVQQSMGPIVDRTGENLCTEDFLVISAREFMLDSLRKQREGETLPALHNGMDHSQIEHRWVFTDSSTSFKEVLENKEWTSGEAGQAFARSDASTETPWSSLPQ